MEVYSNNLLVTGVTANGVTVSPLTKLVSHR